MRKNARLAAPQAYTGLNMAIYEPSVLPSNTWDEKQGHDRSWLHPVCGWIRRGRSYEAREPEVDRTTECDHSAAAIPRPTMARPGQSVTCAHTHLVPF